jgi:hypothetical protein
MRNNQQRDQPVSILLAERGVGDSLLQWTAPFVQCRVNISPILQQNSAMESGSSE